MTLATASETTSAPRTRNLALSFDAFLMAASLLFCAALFTQGGCEAFLFAVAGALLGARHSVRGLRTRGAYSGGFAGLFVGALFAAFFHDVFVALAQLI